MIAFKLFFVIFRKPFFNAQSLQKMITLPHPFELEVQDFNAYDLVIDARSPREYHEDHLPFSKNLPVVNNDQYAEVGTAHRKDTHLAYVIGVTHSLRNMATWIEEISHTCGPKSRILVYCFRGGKRSKLWSDTLRTIGYNVDVLRGGWKAYRRWVINALETLPRNFDYKVLTGPTGCGKTRLLHALHEQGAQVLDLEGLALHRGSLIGAIPGVAQPSQKLFDSELLKVLRTFNPDRPIWVEGESKKIGNVQLPSSLMEVMWTSSVVKIEAPMEERIRLWREDFGHFEADPESLMAKLQFLKPIHGNVIMAEWQTLATQKKTVELFEQLMTVHYDTAYARSTPKNYREWHHAEHLFLPSLEHSKLVACAKELIAKNEA